MGQDRVVIGGAGPAGVRCAQVLVAAGIQPVLIDENRRDGGQIYRRQPEGFTRSYPTLYGAEAERARALHAEGVNGITYRTAKGASRTLACDAVAMGYHLRPETQLADLARCEFRFDAETRQWLPAVDRDGRSSVPRVYLAGDGARVLGAAGAEIVAVAAGIPLEQVGRLRAQAPVKPLALSTRKEAS